jgi:DNA (cytosine-5)-methyltransferase 1
VRMFLVCTRSKAPLNLQLHQRRHVPASSFILHRFRCGQMEQGREAWSR